MNKKQRLTFILITLMCDKTNRFRRFSCLFDNYTYLIFIRLKVC